jgi:hypothetical protein
MKTCKHPCCSDTHCRKAKPEKKWRAKPRTMSDKRMRELAQYRKDRIKFLTARPQCGAQIFPICTYEATQVHHKGGRENDLLLEQSLWLPICHGCHQFVTENSKQAIEWGLSVSRLNKA